MSISQTDTLPESVGLDAIHQVSDDVLARPSQDVRRSEDIFTVTTMGLEWDIGAVVLEPNEVAVGADGKRAGVFILHGGSGDFRTMEPFGRMLAEKFGFKVLLGTFPGRFYLPDPSRDWPDDTIHADGSVRTPVWRAGELVSRDQYDIVQDASMRGRYGTRTLAKARPGTQFYHRMAAWPAAFEEGMISANARHFPEGEFSVYGTGHSTGGPFICMLSQRIVNFAGILSMEHSPFGYICQERDLWEGPLGQITGYERTEEPGTSRTDPFDELYIRTWRDLARYAGPEALGAEGATALMRLPALMEDVLASWEKVRSRPQFKAEYIVTHCVEASLIAAARVTAARLGLSESETAGLEERFVGYTREMSSPGCKPVPPTLFSIAKHSRDHSREVYEEVIIPAFRKMDPAPQVHLTCFDAGGHSYWKPEAGLPLGVGPAVGKLWKDAITGGYFVLSGLGG